MRIWLKGACLAILAGWVLVTPAPAQNFNMKITADGIQIGTHIMGPELKAEDLKGKVIVLEFWGTN
jgi:hypothetical protein